MYINTKCALHTHYALITMFCRHVRPQHGHRSLSQKRASCGHIASPGSDVEHHCHSRDCEQGHTDNSQEIQDHSIKLQVGLSSLNIASLVMVTVYCLLLHLLTCWSLISTYTQAHRTCISLPTTNKKVPETLCLIDYSSTYCKLSEKLHIWKRYLKLCTSMITEAHIANHHRR